MFRRFKMPALYLAVLISVGYFLYQVLDALFSISDWATEKKGLWQHLWAAAVSREGSVIVTGVIAAFVLATVLVERRLDAARDVKWKRRKRVLESRTRRLSKTKAKPLTAAQRNELFTFQKQIKGLYEAALHGPKASLKTEIEDWEKTAGGFLEAAWDMEHRAFVMDAPYSPANRAGMTSQNYFIGWTEKRLERMNALIEELRAQ